MVTAKSVGPSPKEHAYVPLNLPPFSVIIRVISRVARPYLVGPPVALVICHLISITDHTPANVKEMLYNSLASHFSITLE